jgi:hypothetical protein
MKGSRSIVGVAIALGLSGGSAMGVAAQEEAPSVPVEFTGHIACGPEVRHGTDTSETLQVGDEQVRHSGSHGYAWQPTATMSDPRLEGDYYGSFEWDEYGGSEGTTWVGAGTWRIENDEGAWQGSHTSAYLSDSPDASASGVLIGEGAYEGLVVLWEEVLHWDACSWDVRGLIVEGGPPAVPEPYVPEPATAFTELRVTDVAELDARTRDLTGGRPGWLVFGLVERRRGWAPSLGDVPPHRVPRHPRARLARLRRARHRRALDGRLRDHALRDGPPRALPGRSRLQRRPRPGRCRRRLRLIGLG